jgi:hypothetical protein
LTAQDKVPHHEDALFLGIHDEVSAVNDFHVSPPNVPPAF